MKNSSRGMPTSGLKPRVKRQTRPNIEAKETYCRGKRDLLQRQKRPTDS